MQHIGLHIETSDGQRMTSSRDEDGSDHRLVVDTPPTSVCLRFVDPRGDTVFERLQVHVLVEGVAQMAAKCDDAGFRLHAQRPVAWLEAEVEPHTYVRFVGE